MKRVLLVTKISRNFGALLQAYALKTKIEQMNAEVEILNLNFDQTAMSYKALPRISGVHTLKRFMSELPFYSERKKAIERSLCFRNEFFNLTKSYSSYDGVKREPPKADIYFTGSDQVWNPINNFDKSYYLLFGSAETVRASYAASIAIEEIPKEYQKEFPLRVRNMDYISVREETGKKLLAKYGIESQVHLDPTLLLEREDYEELLVKPDIQEPYVLLYFIRMPTNPEKIVNRVRVLYPDRKIVLVIGETRVRRLGDIQVLNAGPREFLGLIRYADAVITTSFHGTVFSCLFQKDFAVILPSAVGGRISNLLETVDMNKHVVSKSSQISYEVLRQEHSLFDSPFFIEKRNASILYLQKILESNSNCFRREFTENEVDSLY